MADVYDVVVIGAGIEGSSAAYHSAKAGKKVLLLEQYSLPHSRGSSHSGTRIICFAKTADHHQKLMNVCYPMWEELGKETKTELIREIGVLNFSEKWTDGYPKTLLDSMKKSGAGLEQLSLEERTHRFPNISYPSKPESYLYQKGGYIRANKALQCFQNEFIKHGGILHDEEAMLEIVPGTKVTVKTNRSEYQTRSVILAPGPWASKVLQQLGLNIPLQVGHCHHLFWREKEPGMYADIPIYDDQGVNGFEASAWPSGLEYPGMMKVGRWSPMPIGSPEDDPGSINSSHDIELTRAHVREHFPGLDADNGPAIAEACFATCTPDFDFVIDVHPEHANIVFGCGFSGHGFMMAPIVGRILSQLALGATPDVDITAFRMNRFESYDIKTGA